MNNPPNFPGSSGPLPSRDIFDQALEEILERESPIAYSIITGTQRMINQFRLKGVEPNDLLIQAYLRGKDALRAGKQVNNAVAWLRGTVYNIVREEASRRRKTCSFSPDWIENLCIDSRYDPQALAGLEEEISALHRSLSRLKREAPQVFFLIEERYNWGKSWQEIEVSYVARFGEVGISQDTLRQRCSRGLKNLRRFFHEVYSV